MNISHQLIVILVLFPLTFVFAEERGYPGKVEVDSGPGEVVLQGGKCFLRVRGNFRCSQIDHRDADQLISTGTAATIDFHGRDTETAVTPCACDEHSHQHFANWVCHCPAPKTGNGTFLFNVTCKSTQTGEVHQHQNAPRAFSVSCP